MLKIGRDVREALAVFRPRPRPRWRFRPGLEMTPGVDFLEHLVLNRHHDRSKTFEDEDENDCRGRGPSCATAPTSPLDTECDIEERASYVGQVGASIGPA